MSLLARDHVDADQCRINRGGLEIIVKVRAFNGLVGQIAEYYFRTTTVSVRHSKFMSCHYFLSIVIVQYCKYLEQPSYSKISTTRVGRNRKTLET